MTDKPLGKYKYCAIYIRTSSEKQGEKASPVEQERDCRAYAEGKGYIVVAVYRDTERFRDGKKLVEPSGTRSDRPEWLKMIADAKAEKFDTIIGWKEDRFYRGVNKAMLDLSELVTKHGINVECVKDVYTADLAVIRAWAAGYELKSRHDRMTMGVRARLESGKITHHLPIYGYSYSKEVGMFVLNPIEAEMVYNVFLWRSQGYSHYEIAQMCNAKGWQKRDSAKHTNWTTDNIAMMLSRSFYHDAEISQEHDGERFVFKLERIVPLEIVEIVKQMRIDYKTHPSGRTKTPALCQGKIYCRSCNMKMSYCSKKKVKKAGYKPAGIYEMRYYMCPHDNKRYHVAGCAKKLGTQKVDDSAWMKLWNFISDIDALKRLTGELVEKLESAEVNAEERVSEIQRQLTDCLMEKDELYRMRRKKLIDDDGLSRQLAEITMLEKDLNKQLGQYQIAVDNKSDKLSQLMDLYSDQIMTAYNGINDPPIDEEDAQIKFRLKQKVFHSLVKRVWANEDKTVDIELEIDLPLNVAVTGYDLGDNAANQFHSDKGQQTHVYLNSTISSGLIPIEGTVFDKHYVIRATI